MREHASILPCKLPKRTRRWINRIWVCDTCDRMWTPKRVYKYDEAFWAWEIIKIRPDNV